MKHLIGLIVLIISFVSFSSYELSYGETAHDANKICLECHLKFSEKMETQEVHMPVQEGKCIECHNPHTSKYPGLLNYLPGVLCFKCHKKERGFAGPFVHEPVRNRECLSCHQHHSSSFEGLLKKKGADICFECHPEQDIIANNTTIHPEVKKGNCTICHLPHSGSEEKLLVKDKRSLCVECHTGNGVDFVQSHQGYSVVPSDCLICHSPHSSDRQKLLRANLHKPFAKGNCLVCHNPPALAGSIEVLKDGTSLCIDCHEDTKADFYKIYSHLTTGKETNLCNNCHNPHASDEKGLLKDKEDRVCYQCHSDTKQYVRKAKFKHTSLERCSDCHSPHGSNNDLLFTLEGDAQCLQGGCHPVQGRFTHPVGEGIIDPRSKKPMDCSTCHNPMGSPERFILRLEKDKKLCIQCHQL